ncbi:MAG: tripartite tricarboxylate transporter TctB family protein [Cohaesibacter sp.]|nr:tripartite tricarboxylate transporter TctB family protein [Cohaesibacter sp.]
MTRSRMIAESLVILALFALAALVFQQSATSLADQFANEGDAIENAALYPKALAYLLIALGCLQMLMIVRGFAPNGLSDKQEKTPKIEPETEAETEPQEQHKQQDSATGQKAIMASCLFIAYLLVLDPLGYHLASPAAMFAFFWLLGVRPLLKALVVAVLLSLTVALFFEVLLKVVLPLGLFNLALPI